MDKLYLGIDTSAYTTSLAVVDGNGNIKADVREVLKVDSGKIGLRQQEAIFQHMNNLPQLITLLRNTIDMKILAGVSASVRPRNIQGSYMPVFRVSQGQALIISKILNIPYKEFSHQEGHIAAALRGLEPAQVGSSIALHISGGTTELLYVENNEKGYSIEIIGGTKDINGGQLIDRIGTKLGLDFPSGKALDLMSNSGKILDIRKPISTKDTWLNFSGTETYFQKIIDEGNYNTNDIALTLFYCIGNSLWNIIYNAIEKYKVESIIIVGGVAANSFFRGLIESKINEYGLGTLYMPDGKYCTDNSTGIAYLGAVKKGHNC